MEIFFDIEQRQYVTEKQLFLEYKNQLEAGLIDYDFPHFLDNCHVRNNGTLYTAKEYESINANAAND